MDKARAEMGAKVTELEANFDASERERATLAKTRAGSVVIVGLACYAVEGGKRWLRRKSPTSPRGAGLMKASKGAEGFWLAMNATGTAKSGILKIVAQVLLIDPHIPTS
jgi:hypothetical protein